MTISLHDTEASVLLTMLTDEVTCYCKLLSKGIYKGREFDQCRARMQNIGDAFLNAAHYEEIEQQLRLQPRLRGIGADSK